MRVKACRTYHSKTVEKRLVRMADGKSVFKIYYVSIIGRDEPAKFEWEHCESGAEEFEALLKSRGFEGVGFVIAFPHITKIFRFAPTMETVMHVRAFNTRDLSPLDLTREDGYIEFACYAEAAIAADEYHGWARARSVKEYLVIRSGFDDGPIINNAKLLAYANAP